MAENFQPINIEQSPLESAEFADGFLKAYRTAAKSSMKTKQSIEQLLQENQKSSDAVELLVEKSIKDNNEIKEDLRKILLSIAETVGIVDDFIALAYENGNDMFVGMAKTLGEAVGEQLEKMDIKRLAQVGDEVNPEHHFVVSNESKSGKQNKIKQVVRQGYSFRGTLIRKSDVIVGEV